MIKAQSTDTPNLYPVTMVIHCLPHTHKHAAYNTLGKTGRRHVHCSFLHKLYLLPSSFCATLTAPNSNSKCGSDWIHTLLFPQHKTPALTWEGWRLPELTPGLPHRDITASSVCLVRQLLQDASLTWGLCPSWGVWSDCPARPALGWQVYGQQRTWQGGGVPWTSGQRSTCAEDHGVEQRT